MIRCALFTVALGLQLGMGSIAEAQSYPTRPIRMIVAVGTGSVGDVIMRATAKELHSRLGQPVVVENEGTANGLIAARNCARAANDGYTICAIAHTIMVFNPIQLKDIGYDPNTDFELVSRLYFVTEALAASSSLKVKSFDELKAYAQSNTRSLNFGTNGPGSTQDIFVNWLNKQWSTNVVGVPFRGGGQIAPALASNTIQVSTTGIGNVLGLVEAGSVTLLAVNAQQRSALLPNVPTYAEAGVRFPDPNYQWRPWWGVVAPRGTSPAIVNRLNKELLSVYADKEFVQFLEKQATVPAPIGPEEFADFLKEDRKAAEAMVAFASKPSN